MQGAGRLHCVGMLLLGPSKAAICRRAAALSPEAGTAAVQQQVGWCSELCYCLAVGRTLSICGCPALTKQRAGLLLHSSEHPATICSASARQGHLKQHSTRAGLPPSRFMSSAAHVTLLGALWSQMPGCRGLSKIRERGQAVASIPCKNCLHGNNLLNQRVFELTAWLAWCGQACRTSLNIAV